MSLRPAMLLAALACVPLALAQSVRLISLETRGAIPPEAEDVAFGQFPKDGISVSAGLLVFPGEGASLVEIDEDKCQVSTVLDAASMQPSNAKLKFGGFPRLSKSDGAPGLISLEYEGPAIGTLKVAGTLHATISKGIETIRIPAQSLANGTILKAGELSLKVGELMVGDDKIKLVVSSTKAMTNIRRIRFLAGDGKEVKSERNGSSRMNMMGAFKEEWNFTIHTGSKNLAVEIDLAKDSATAKIPFELTLPASL